MTYRKIEWVVNSHTIWIGHIKLRYSALSWVHGWSNAPQWAREPIGIAASSDYLLDSESCPNTGCTAGIELICWLPALRFNAEEVVLAGTHWAIVKPPLGTGSFIRKSPAGSAPDILSWRSAQTPKKLQAENLPASLTLWWSSATVRETNSDQAGIICDLTSAGKVRFDVMFNSKPGRRRS